MNVRNRDFIQFGHIRSVDYFRIVFDETQMCDQKEICSDSFSQFLLLSLDANCRVELYGIITHHTAALFNWEKLINGGVF